MSIPSERRVVGHILTEGRVVGEPVSDGVILCELSNGVLVGQQLLREMRPEIDKTFHKLVPGSEPRHKAVQLSVVGRLGDEVERGVVRGRTLTQLDCKTRFGDTPIHDG